MQNNPHCITLAKGNLYIDFPIYDAYFRAIDHVVLLSKPPLTLIMPVHQTGAGGLLLKIRNARGDRVVNALEFLQHLEIDVLAEKTIPVQWSQDYAALTFTLDLNLNAFEQHTG